MNSERYRTQSAIELEVGCSDLTQWPSFKPHFERFEITDSNRHRIQSDLKLDAADLYFKGIFSLSDALNSIFNGRHSWAVIKAYYAVFFLLRCSLATHNIAFLKNNGIYTLKIEAGEKPVKRDKGKFEGEHVRGDHKTTISTFYSLFSDTDILLSNQVGGKNIYSWLMELRNQVNYRERTFTEPEHKYFHHHLFDKVKMKEQIREYLEDDIPVYCFDQDHCALAAPIRLILMVRDRLYNFIDFEPLNSEKKSEIEKLIGETCLLQLSDFRKLYEFSRD